MCPHHCKLDENQRGICFGRMRYDDQMVLTTYGKSSGFAIDPIEKKPLYHFLPGTTTYSFGTIGCNLLCKFCQNWSISQNQSSNDYRLLESPPENIAQMAKKLGCESVAFTYNEPTVFAEYAIDVAKECHTLGLKTVAVTNGYICAKPRQELYASIDAANVDLKGFTESFYKKLTGAHLQPVLDTLIYLKQETKVWLEITTLLIPGENDSNKELEGLSIWVRENLGSYTPLHFSAFYPAAKLQDKPATTPQTVVKAREIALKNGLNYVYAGNICFPDGNTTFCHNCKKAVIIRNGYNLSKLNLDQDGKCKFCHAKCAGFF